MVHLDSVCLQGADTALRGSGDSHTRQQVLQVPLSTRTFSSLLLATAESCLQSQRAFGKHKLLHFSTLIRAFERCDSQG